MVLNRNQNHESLVHMLDTVFGLEDKHPLKLALADEGINNMSNLLTMTLPMIDGLKYIPEGSTQVGVLREVPKGNLVIKNTSGN